MQPSMKEQSFGSGINLPCFLCFSRISNDLTFFLKRELALK